MPLPLRIDNQADRVVKDVAVRDAKDRPPLPPARAASRSSFSERDIMEGVGVSLCFYPPIGVGCVCKAPEPGL